MKKILLFTICILFIACSTGRYASEQASEKEARILADSIEYASLKDAFIKGDFIVRVKKIIGHPVVSTVNWLKISDSILYCQIGIDSYSHRDSPVYYTPSVCQYSARINRQSIATNSKKKTITIAITELKKEPDARVTLTYYENSNIVQGYIQDHLYPFRNVKRVDFEGVIELPNNTTIVEGEKSIADPG